MRATTRTPPQIHPIIPVHRPAPFNHADWLFEPKYDGFRGVLYCTGNRSVLFSKRGNLMKRFQQLASLVGNQLGCRAVLDGEIVALGDDGRISFWDLMRGRGTLAFAAFDILWLNGRDLRLLSLARRKRRLERLIPTSSGALSRVPSFPEEGRELFDAACSLDLEGIVAKRKADTYQLDTAWYKIKNPAYTQAEGRRELFERR